jgi:hypothetical protein
VALSRLSVKPVRKQTKSPNIAVYRASDEPSDNPVELIIAEIPMKGLVEVPALCHCR